ncbi:hypothetical protein [Rhabdochlamydiaceae symbiont of Dictyostelium giganteum]|uniref:hypothetical protein n=1 Tax=Rhabdochlamydiaceae symbiont of Dictyostelium giganteum TaxID=3342349 RepID=UPI003850AC90
MSINLQTFRDLAYTSFCYGYGLSAISLKEAAIFIKNTHADPVRIQMVEMYRWNQIDPAYNYLDLESYYSDWAFSSGISNINVIGQILEESLSLIKKEHKFSYIPQHFYSKDFLASQIMTRVIYRKIYEITLESPSLSPEKAGELAIASLQAAVLLDQTERKHNPQAKLRHVTYCKGIQSHLTKKCVTKFIRHIVITGFVIFILNCNPIHLLKNAISAKKINDLLHSRGLNFFSLPFRRLFPHTLAPPLPQN